MVRNYVRVSNHALYDVETIIKALKTLKESKRSVAKVAKEFNMTSSALSYHWKMHNNKENVDVEGVYKKRHSLRILSVALENELLSYVIACANIYSTVSRPWVREMAYELAIENKRTIPKNWKTNKMAGKDWWLQYLQRHKTALTRQDSGSKSLIQMIESHKNIGHLFNDNYTKVLAKYKFQPQDVFILEQCKIKQPHTSIVASTNANEKSSKKSDARKSSTPKGKLLVTFVGTISAIGQSIPPYYIFSHPHYHNHQLLQEAPKGSKAKSDPTGTMTKKIFVNYLKHVVHNVKCSDDRPALLLLDNDGYHFSLAAVKLAKKHGIVILTFPPRTTNKLQHVEHSLFGGAKTEIEEIKSEKMTVDVASDENEKKLVELVEVKSL